MPSTIRVLLVDNDPACRELVRSTLRRDGVVRVIGEAADAWQAITKVTALQPDVVVTDLAPPSIGGLEIVSWVQEQQVRAGVVILTAYEEQPYVIAALKCGALGYVPKRSMVHELPRAVRLAASGEVYVSPLLLAAGDAGKGQMPAPRLEREP
ncbi:MAG TPA: response regulator transcription factor [Chloroflexota bacterium]|nr:response regulator transcription factor [Chloroflexota bacterium]